MGRSSVGPWGAWISGPIGAGAVTAISAGHLLQVFHQRVELVRGDRRLEVLGRDPTPEPLRDLGVGVDDRGLDERLVLALEGLVEVRADGLRRARVREGVGGAAAVVG